jgi:hypothetical protein
MLGFPSRSAWTRINSRVPLVRICALNLTTTQLGPARKGRRIGDSGRNKKVIPARKTSLTIRLFPPIGGRSADVIERGGNAEPVAVKG